MTHDKPEGAVGFFSDNAKEFRDMYRAQPEFQERLELWRGLLDRYAVADGFSVDMGCGPGIFSFYLAGKSKRVAAVDGATEMVALCEEQRRERGLENVEFSQGFLPNIDEAKFANADLLISSSVVEYVADLDATLALFARALKAQGTLILSMPNLLSLSRLQQRIKFRLTGDPEIYRHIKHFSSPLLLKRRSRRSVCAFLKRTTTRTTHVSRSWHGARTFHFTSRKICSSPSFASRSRASIGVRMQEEPLVSVVTPFHNSADYLAEAIQSTLAQSHSNFELLLVNNKSTDASRDIAADYAQRDSRIKIFDNDAFVPQLQNYNGALSRISVHSKYVKFVQADDAILPECLRSMVAVAERAPEIGLVSAYYLYGTDAAGAGLPRDVWQLSGREVCRRMLLTKAFLVGSPSVVMYRADLVRAQREFFRTDRYHADTDAAYRMLLESDFGFVHQVLSFVRSDNDGITPKQRAFNPGPLDYLIMIERYGREVLSEPEFRELSTREWSYYWGFLGTSLLRKRGPDFWAYHRKGLATIGMEPKLQRMLGGAFKKVATTALGPLNRLKR